MKKTISLLLIAVLLVACMTTTAFAAKAGETVNVTLTATGSEPFTDFDANLSYDSSVLTISGTPIGGFGYLNGTKIDWAVTEDVTSAGVFNLSVAIAPNAEHKTYTITGTSNHAFNQAAEAAGTVTLYAEVTVECDYTFKTEVVAPTCTSAGYTRHYCECGKYIDDTATSATGHKWELVSSTEGVNCLTSGDDAYKCSVCGESKSNANDKFGPHAYNAYKYNDTHHWMICDHDNSHETEKQTHNFVIDLGDKLGCICGATKDKTTTPTNPTPTNPGAGGDMGDITPYPVFFLMAVAAVLGTAYGFKRFAK